MFRGNNFDIRVKGLLQAQGFHDNDHFQYCVITMILK